MERIAIIGCGGSGKTTLGRRLSELTGAAVTHLDACYYDGRWNSLSQEEFARMQYDLVARPRWIIDGNYAATLPIRLERADIVIFLDLPPATCLLGVLQRRLRHGRAQNADTGVYARITWDFIAYVWNYRATMAPRIRNLLNSHAGHADVHILTSWRAVNRIAVNRLSAAATKRAGSP
jgi:adenylate kinase family enzyme